MQAAEQGSRQLVKGLVHASQSVHRQASGAAGHQRRGGGAQRRPTGTQPTPLLRTHSTEIREAALYGVKYKAPSRWSFWEPEQVRRGTLWLFFVPWKYQCYTKELKFLQVRGAHVGWLKFLGRVGWVAKGLLYALIGGLACDSAVGDESASASPQV